MSDESSFGQPQVIPAPPRAVAVFTFDWANQLNRWLENFARQMTGLVFLRGSGLYLPNLPQTGYGLKPGMVYEHDGVLMVVRDGVPYLSGVSATSGLGELTVSV